MEKTNQLIVAIDGYSSCGKSTLAKALAKELNLLFIDTGAMYRAVTLYAIQHNLFDTNNQLDETQLEAQISNISVSFDVSKSIQNPIILLNNKNVSEEIRTMEVSSRVSYVAANSAVRKKMVEEQRKLSQRLNVVLDGRDIASVVFPNAPIKLFLTASPEIRAQRRYNELLQKDSSFKGTIDEVKANLLERDHIDTTREDSPLVMTADAIEIDNSQLTMDQQLTMVLEIIEKEFGSIK